MGIWDIVLIVLLAAVLVFAVIRCVRTVKRGGHSCCGNCAGCGASCSMKRAPGIGTGGTMPADDKERS